MSQAQRIVHVMGWRSRQYGSFERFIVALSRRCTQEGIESHLVFQAPPTSSAFLADVEAETHVVPIARQVGDPRHLARISRLLRELRPTHLHAHFGYDSYNALAAARMLGVKRRFTTKHIVPSNSWRELPGVRHRWLARQVEVYWTVSQWVAERLLELGVPPERLEVCYLGVDPTAYQPDPRLRARTRSALGIEEQTTVVLSTSHLRPGKGTELLPGLAAQITAQPNDVVLLAAGDGPLRESLSAEASALGVGEGRMRLLGVREDVPALLAAADLFVFPTQANEGMPLGVLEAMAAGLPVVACAVSDIARLPPDALALVPQGDAAALGAACERLLSDRSAASAQAARGQQLVLERFSVQRGVDVHVRRYLSDPREASDRLGETPAQPGSSDRAPGAAEPIAPR
jgi:glycosyltransferase involved in cell wall biosynthesis